jgi:hypothetical protein
MNIQEIKAAINAENSINITSLDMVRQFKDILAIGGELKEDGTTAQPGEKIKVKQPWLSHWDNANRIRITMHEEIFVKLMANKAMGGLAIKFEQIAAEPAKGDQEARDAYKRYVVITPLHIEGTF